MGGRLTAMTPNAAASWRTSLREMVPSGILRRYSLFKFYAVKSRWGVEAIRNILLDWKYGGYCGGRIRTRFAGSGAHPTVSTDYYQLPKLFGPEGVRVRPDDVLVDVGCGKGRVLNYWLHSGLKNRIYGLELDPEFAGFAARRLAKFRNVTILAGDAIANLPDDATLIFLYNPFEGDVLERFQAQVKEKYAHRLH